MLSLLVDRCRDVGGGWEARVYRGGSVEWVVCSWGKTRGEARFRARRNFEPDVVFLNLKQAPSGAKKGRVA